MKAVSIVETSDDLSGVRIIEIPAPEPGPGQLRVRMLKSAVHPSDLNYIRGEYRDGIERLIWNYQESQPAFDAARNKLHPELPCIPGGEGVGIVEACGEGMDTDQWLGKRVALTVGPPNGTWQEQVLATGQQAMPLPDALPDEQAALVMINPLTALVMTRNVLAAQEGQWLLMSAGASAVSKLVAALGRHYGFKTISVVRNRAAADACREQLGDEVVITAEQDLRAEVKRITGGRGVELALDCVGGDTGEQLITCLTEQGRMLLYGTLAAPKLDLYSRDLMMTNATVGGFYLPGWLSAQAPETLGKVMTELTELSATGLLFSPVEAQYPITEALEAVKASRQPGRVGKILLDFTA